ncbi:Protein of unknown function, partial [Gryllus bimaculatus]
ESASSIFAGNVFQSITVRFRSISWPLRGTPAHLTARPFGALADAGCARVGGLQKDLGQGRGEPFVARVTPVGPFHRSPRHRRRLARNKELSLWRERGLLRFRVAVNLKVCRRYPNLTDDNNSEMDASSGD